MSFKKRKKGLWRETTDIQKRIDQLVDANLKSELTDEVGTIIGLLDSIQPTDEIHTERDMLGFCREELEKIKNRLFQNEKTTGINWEKMKEHYPNRHDKRNRKKEVGFHSSIGERNVPSSYSTPTMNDVKFIDNLVCIKQGENEVFKLIFNKETYSKMMMYTKLLNVEITGLIEVRVENNKFYLDDIHLFRQKVSGAQCEMEDDLAIVELMDKMIKAGKNPGSLKCWWHSHNTMGTSPSGTDTTTGEKFANKEFLITLITNQNGDIYSKLNFYKPILFEIEDLGIYVDYTENREQMLTDCKTEIEKMVKNSYSTPSYGSREYGATYSYPYGMEDYSEFDNYPIYPSVPVRTNENSVIPISEEKILKRSEVGDNYRESGLQYVWNNIHLCYDVFNSCGMRQTQEELKLLGAREIIDDSLVEIKNSDLFNK